MQNPSVIHNEIADLYYSQWFACLTYDFDFHINRQQVNISPGESDDSEFEIVSAIFWAPNMGWMDVIHILGH